MISLITFFLAIILDFLVIGYIHINYVIDNTRTVAVKALFFTIGVVNYIIMHIIVLGVIAMFS